MRKKKTSKMIRYAIIKNSNLVVSIYGDVIAWPTPDSNTPFGGEGVIKYHLESKSLSKLTRTTRANLAWTKSLTPEIKNLHRKHWGLEELTKENELKSCPQPLV
jgi:hypothetical protein